MINDAATPLVVEIARSFMLLMRGLEQNWNKAYLRFSWQGSVSEAKASYVIESGAEIVDSTKNKDFFHPVLQKGKDLLMALGKDGGVFLLVVDSNLEYDIKFEYKDFNRWKISKLGGGREFPLVLIHEACQPGR